MSRRILRETKQILSNISTVQTAPSNGDAGETLAGNGSYNTFQVIIPGTATAVVTLYGRLAPEAPWTILETVTVSGVRVHLGTPYVIARVTSYSGTGGVNVWATRDVI